MIRLRHLSKSFAGEPAVEIDELRFEEGRTTVLIGPSGCGKSTLLRLLIGLENADAGEIVVDGDAVTPESVRGIRHRTGYVIQEGGLFPHLSARDNVTLLVRHLGWSASRIHRRLSELADLVRLPGDRLGDFPLQFSGGERQRVCLMRALMHDPDLLLLDEPLGALDPMIRAELQVQLRDIIQAVGKTVILVTHDLAEADFFGDRIVLMRAGRIEQSGSFEQLESDSASPFVRSFIRAQRLLHLPGEAGG